jgi:hypothetical protein
LEDAAAGGAAAQDGYVVLSTLLFADVFAQDLGGAEYDEGDGAFPEAEYFGVVLGFGAVQEDFVVGEVFAGIIEGDVDESHVAR